MLDRFWMSAAVSALLAAGPLAAQQQRGCPGLPDAAQLKAMLAKAPNEGGDAGGLFHGKREWGVVVNRAGQVCAVTASPSPSQVWPGSLPIAKSKAFTANAFSLDSLPLSTARLYTLTQPGHSLYGTPFASPFNPRYLMPATQAGSQELQIQGGAIAYGGGLALYKNGVVIGALGVSGDTSCADHEIAKRVRSLLSLDPPGGLKVDDIIYPSVDGPSIYAQPMCENTWRNGKFLGNEIVGAEWWMAQNKPKAATVSHREKEAKKPK